MFTRYASAVTSGTVITFGLLFVMQLLITLQPGAVIKPSQGFGVDWRRIDIPEPPDVPRQELIDKKKLTETKLPPKRLKTSGSGEPLLLAKSSPAAPAGLGLPTFNDITDGPLVSLVRVSPVYPAKALANQTEGYVIVEFDVTDRGQVTNVVTVDSSNEIFNKAAIKAAERFKFKPRVVDGQALWSYSIRNMFTFRIADQ